MLVVVIILNKQIIMTENLEQPPQTPPGRIDDLIQFCAKHSNTVLCVVGALMVLSVGLLQWGRSSQVSSERDFVEAISDFDLIQAGQEDIHSPLKSLELSLERHPELHQRFDGAIAQDLVARDLVQEALPFAKASLERAAEQLNPLLKSFSQTSLFIAEKKFELALEKSKELDGLLSARIAQDSEDGEQLRVLHAFNLLRIATLQKTLEKPQEEKKAWLAWQELLGLNGQDGREDQAYLIQAFESFQVQNLSLFDYVNARLKQL